MSSRLVQSPDQVFTQFLLRAGYDRDEARWIMDNLRDLRSANTSSLASGFANFQQFPPLLKREINEMMERWNRFAPSARTVSELSSQQIGQIMTGLRGRNEPIQNLISDPVPLMAPTVIRTDQNTYEVRLGTSSYQFRLPSDYPFPTSPDAQKRLNDELFDSVRRFTFANSVPRKTR